MREAAGAAPAPAAPPEPTKFCSKCQAERPLPGGVQRTREKWHCGQCWRLFAMNRRPGG